MRYLDTWQWSEALDDANEALRLQPGSARAMLVRGAAKAGLEDVAAGLHDLAEAEKRGERSPRLYCEQGLAYCAVMQYDKALEAAERARKINPNEPRVYGLRGKVIAAQKGLNAALEDLNKAVDLDPQSAYGYGVRGEVMADWDINLGPEPPDIGILRQHNAHVVAECLPAILAVPHLSRAIQLDPDNPRYYADRGAAFEKLSGLFAQALRDLDRAVALNPKFVRAYKERFTVKAMMHDYKNADLDAQRMIELAPSYWGGHHAHGFYLTMTGDWEHAKKDSIWSSNWRRTCAARDFTMRASYWHQHCKFSEAVADATMALEIDPHQLDARSFRGAVLAGLGQWRKALGEFEILRPDRARLRALLGESRRSQIGVGGR